MMSEQTTTKNMQTEMNIGDKAESALQTYKCRLHWLDGSMIEYTEHSLSEAGYANFAMNNPLLAAAQQPDRFIELCRRLKPEMAMPALSELVHELYYKEVNDAVRMAKLQLVKAT